MRPIINRVTVSCIATLGLLSATSAADATTVKVTVTNMAPTNGVFIMPAWVGFHNGTFDTYDLGSAASLGIERAAEDGNNSELHNLFVASGDGTVDGTLGPGPAGSGQVKSATFTLNRLNPDNRYFSFIQMLIPSNDGFWGNDDPTAYQIFDVGGHFMAQNILILGSNVLDAGTEVNDEVFAKADTAFFGQAVANTGTNENGVVHVHPGYVSGGEILSFIGNNGFFPVNFTGADFTQSGYEIARITVEAVDEPASLALFGAGLAGLTFVKRRQNRPQKS
jgi:hypothetical protein